MMLTNLMLPNSSNMGVKQENTFSIIVACYATDFFFLSINASLLVTS